METNKLDRGDHSQKITLQAEEAAVVEIDCANYIENRFYVMRRYWNEDN